MEARRCLRIGAFFITFCRKSTTGKGEENILKAPSNGIRTPEQLRTLIEEALDADKAENVETIDLRNHSCIADYMIVASGRSSTQVGALAKKLSERLKIMGHGFIHVEGTEHCNWVIVDAGDIIVHIFRPEVREYYNIEKMWSHTPMPSGRMNSVGLHTVA